MSKTKKIGFLIFVAFSSITLLVWRLFLHDNRPYLRGDVIRLIDELDNDNIRQTPLRISLKTIRGERLNQGWKKLATLESGIAIWQTRSSQFSVTTSSSSLDQSARVFSGKQSMQPMSDIFKVSTPAECWCLQNDEVLISLPRGEDPNLKRYFIDYKTFKNLNPAVVDGEILKNPINWATIDDGRSSRRIVAYPTQYPMQVRQKQAGPVGIVIRENGQALPYQPDMLAQITAASKNTVSIYPSIRSSSATPLPLLRSTDKFVRRLRVSPGPYIIRLIAKASLAGPEAPRAIIRIDGREIARQQITTEDWQPYFIHAQITEAHSKFSLGYANDYFDPQTRRDRNIFISGIDLQPDQSSSGIQIAPHPGSTWSWLDNSEDVLKEALPLGMFKMFGQKDVYVLRRFFRPGIATFRITARADLAGEENPRVAVYLDKKRVGTLVITDTELRDYALENITLTEGRHEMKLIFENDFYDTKELLDRNVFLTQVVLKYVSAVLVNEPPDQPPGRYTVSYPSQTPYLAQLHNYREFSAKEADRINPVSYRIDLGRDIRNALVCPPQTRLIYPLQVPPGGRLKFSYGASFLNYAQSEKENRAVKAQLIIRAKEGFHASRTIFSTTLQDSNSNPATLWREAEVDLDKLAGKEVKLSLETQAVGPEGLGRAVLFIGNPVISSVSHRPPGEPNIILIAADALRADHVSCYGYGRKTSPNIDQWARECVVFEDAVSQASWTLPCFSSFFTSLYPSFHGAAFVNSALRPSETTLAETLRKSGYTTAALVHSAFLYPVHGLSQGFDFYNYAQLDPEEQLQTVVRWLQALKDQKFFLFMHFLLPHSPYRAPHPFRDAFGPAYHPLLNTSDHKLLELEQSGRRLSGPDRNYLVSQYDGAVLYLDDVVQRFLGQVKQLGLYQDTFVIFLSDHGEQFQEHGHLGHVKSLYQEEIHIPLIMKFPSGSGLQAGRFPGIVQGIDIPATILDLIGVQFPDSYQGRSLVPFLRGQPIDDRPAFSELNALGIMAIRKGPYKYIFTYPRKDPGAPRSPGQPKGEAKNREELYDLKKDPEETHDLSAGRPNILEMFRAERKTFSELVARFYQNKVGAKEANRIVLDPAQRERLRALGYLR